MLLLPPVLPRIMLIHTYQMGKTCTSILGEYSLCVESSSPKVNMEIKSINQDIVWLIEEYQVNA